MAPSKLETIDFTTFNNIVAGSPRSSKQKYHGIDPTTKQPNWDVPVATPEDIEDAVAAANKAFAEWKTTTWEYRTERIARFKDAMEAYQEEMIELLLKETGKPRQFGAAEVKGLSQFIQWHVDMKEPKGETYDLEDRTIVNKFVPLGVAAAICPWNFPLLLSLGKVLPAVQMGNAIIVKPSPFTPYTALKMVEIANQVFPPGLVQALGGDDKLGPALVDHPDIHKISFTGSIATGKKVMAAAAKTLKRVTLEMGGNDPSIVLPDADIAKTAPLVAMGAFFNTSQVCVASKRIYVHSSIYDAFLEALVNVAKSLKVGPSNDDGVMLGPIQNSMQYEKVKTFFKDTKEHGYKFALGSGDVPETNGFFINPTIVDNPPDDSFIVQEEPFGPIVPVQKYDDIDEVIRRANNSRAGLGATVFGKDAQKLQEVADKLEAGMVWINSYPAAGPQAQFGGVKESGIGTEFGTLGILAYANVKAITTMKEGATMTRG
ncbi:putative aldehyde dehydrogenase-like protein [Cladophialophora carrionii]|uniref:aldehyde dehydrogenase (NAD(+)) n=1 Tax=Cladophialophora carrionii TaxID=86049 RepID=A0A1C1CNE3_9EURO|nr:putative aldehyde dehydrogenase-like protein [Cladophialophora carrionii]